jgi:hypothetical protein
MAAAKKTTKASSPKEESKVEEPKEATEESQEVDTSKEEAEASNDSKDDPTLVVPTVPEVETPEEAPNYYPSPYGRRVVQKAVLYTDGLSGTADLNHERAYEYNEKLQSTNPVERAAGDESLSEAAAAAKSEVEKREAAAAKQGSQQ